MLDYFPKYFTNKAILIYLVSLIIISVIFFNNILHLTYWIFGLIQVLGFFYFSNLLTKNWNGISVKSFQKKLFATAFIIRIIWVISSYFLFISWNGNPFEWHTGDAAAYHELGRWLNSLIKEGEIQQYFDYFKGRYSDSGYSFFLGFQYVLTDDSILIARLIKALLSAFTAVFAYKLASRTFGESIGRMAGIMIMLMPSLIYYTGLHLKETEMVFIIVWYIERVDALIRRGKFSFNTLWLPLLLVFSLFFIRTILAVTAIFSLFITFILTSDRVLKFGKRIVIGIVVIVSIVFFLGSQYVVEIGEMWNQRNTSQSQSMNWRATQKGGNVFAKYASTAIFAPVIFIIPFPTMVNIDGQEIQMFMNGGNFIKNIFAFFVLYALYWILKEKKWRDFLLILIFVIGYLGVLAMSAFAQSERFHQPVIPFLLILAAFGISKITNKQKNYFIVYIIIIFAIDIFWNWFKLSGRGMI